jgi:hypothetical protein
VRVGVLVTGDVVVRAAHSLAAEPTVDEVVVIGPATSKTFPVVADAEGCDLLVGTGPTAPERARQLGVRLLWDGEIPEEGVAVYGGSPQGLALALAAREADPQLVAVAHPALAGGNDHKAPFPHPVGRLGVRDAMYGGRRVAVAQSPNEYAAALTVGVDRKVAIVDDADFLSGVALAATVSVVEDQPVAVWETALSYLKTATGMGLVMAEGI